MTETNPKFSPDPSGWLGCELANDPSWIVHFSPSELAELDRALRLVVDKRLPLLSVRREDFVLPTLGPRLEECLTQLSSGRGFVVLRGLPVERYSDEEVSIIYWGIGTYLGSPVKQNAAGDLLGHVRDFGKKWGELGVRGYETNGQLIFHTDLSDLVGLLCLRKARSGGLSRISSSVTVHNEILRHHPEYMPIFYRGFRYIKREAVDSDSPVTGHVPVFGWKDDVLSCRIIQERIESAYRRIGEPLSGIERDALDYFAAVAGSDRVCLSMDLIPGDMQFLNNYTILHSRTSYVDGPGPEEKRHMLRLWLTSRSARRPLAPGFPQSNGYGTSGTPPPPGAVELGLAIA